MNKLLSIGEIAKKANTTTETLRHYDRIGLLKPSKIDSISGYRYYSETDLIYLNVINFCKTKNMSLKDIKYVLEKDNLEYIVDFLSEKEKEIEGEIKRLKNTKSQIRLLKDKYNVHLALNNTKTFENQFQEKYIKERTIIKIEEIKDVSIDNFKRFDELLDKKICNYKKDEFKFDDSVSLMMELNTNECAMFATCNRYPEKVDIVEYLPEGIYLFALCNKDERDKCIKDIINYVKDNYDLNVDSIIQNIIFTGMFKWIYEIQVFLKKS